MALTAKQIKDLNRMNEAARKAELGSLLDDISGDTADIATINADILQLKADVLQLKADVLALQGTTELPEG